MKSHAALAAVLLCLVAPLWALDGQPGLHDPSTVVVDKGRYYTYATGNGLPISVSDDGWTWRRAGSLLSAVTSPRQEVIAKGGTNTWAPDLIKVGDTWFLYYSAPGTQPKSAIGLLVGKTLDSDSPDYKWEDVGPIVWSDGVEDSNAIDPGVFLDRTNGSLWLTYGSYFGYIRLVELDPKTGKRLYPQRAPVLFWTVTTVNAPVEMPNIRLAIGSNAASVWWVNGEEVISLDNDRQAVIDDGVSKRITLKKGPNVVRAAIINAGGATDFCARFLDKDDKPVRNLTVSLTRDMGYR